jgi:stearoyl-CoA desaturase (delta-9 desaturase)
LYSDREPRAPNSRPEMVPIKPSPTIKNKNDYLRAQQWVHALAIVFIPLLGCIAAMLLASRVGISLVDIGLCLGMYILTMTGITVGFHRHFAHHSFSSSVPLRVVLAVLGCMACQGPLIYWVSNHRRHHRYPDQPGDPHSPYFKGDKRVSRLKGLLHAHGGWTLQHDLTNPIVFAKDLLRDPLIVQINRLYYAWVGLSLTLPIILGVLLTNTWMGGLSGFLWGGMVRLFVSYHLTNSINSITHAFGKRLFDTPDYSTNNVWLALPTLGEAWHNNHHAYPSMAVFSRRWWQIDVGGWLIQGLVAMGLVWDIKTNSRRRDGQ